MSQNPSLHSPLTLPCGATLKNRIMKAAMSEQLGDKSLQPTKGLARVYQRWGQGGAGVLITGNVMVDRTALGEPRNVVLDGNSDLESFRAWAASCVEHGSHAWMQLNHPGKQSPRYLSREPVAPSAIALSKGLDKVFARPRALLEAEIQDIIKAFATSAELAQQSGFTGVQLHGAHGYLISQFLSPRHNKRTDGWGGDIDGRMRFLVEVYRAVRQRVGPQFPISVKLNSADFQKGGMTADEAIAVAHTLTEEGVDLIELSGGSYESPAMMSGKVRASTVAREAYFLDLAKAVAEEVNMPIAVTGGFRSSTAMQAAVSEEGIDVVGIARTMALVPDFPSKVLDAVRENTVYRYDLPTLSTGIRMVDSIAVLNITWYEMQIARLAAGKEPKPHASPWRTLASNVASTGLAALTPRRA